MRLNNCCNFHLVQHYQNRCPECGTEKGIAINLYEHARDTSLESVLELITDRLTMLDDLAEIATVTEQQVIARLYQKLEHASEMIHDVRDQNPQPNL